MEFNIHVDYYDVLVNDKVVARNLSRSKAEKVWQTATGDLFEHNKVQLVDNYTGEVIKERR